MAQAASSIERSEASDGHVGLDTSVLSPAVTTGVSKRFQRYFQIGVVCLVVVLSFLYGLVSGVSKHGLATPATVANAVLSASPAELQDEIVLSQLPSGVIPTPLGQDISINGRAAHVAMFRSARPITAIVEEAVSKWKTRGIEAASYLGSTRGAVVGFDRASGTKYALSVWVVPPTLRKVVTAGLPVQGTLAVSGTAEEQLGETSNEVPGVPVMSGGRSGAAFGSRDPGGRSYTAIYRNPFPVYENMQFYKVTLAAEGWVQQQDPFLQQAVTGMSALQFVKGGEEIILLFAPAMIDTNEVSSRGRPTSDDLDNGDFGVDHDRSSTVVTVTRGPDLSRY